MLKRLMVYTLLILGASQAEAQDFPSQQWYVGEVKFIDDTFTKGQLNYDLEHDVVQVKVGDKIKTYSPKQVVAFSIRLTPRQLGGKVSQPVARYFFSIPFEGNSRYKRPRFFEVIIEGKATLLAREYTATVSNNVGRNNNFRRRLNTNQLPGSENIVRTKTVLAHKMYLASLDGTVKELPSKRKDVIFMLKDHSADLKRFIKEEKLSLDNLMDMARLINHYNTLSNNQQSRND